MLLILHTSHSFLFRCVAGVGQPLEQFKTSLLYLSTLKIAYRTCSVGKRVSINACRRNGVFSCYVLTWGKNHPVLSTWNSSVPLHQQTDELSFPKEQSCIKSVLTWADTKPTTVRHSSNIHWGYIAEHFTNKALTGSATAVVIFSHGFCFIPEQLYVSEEGIQPFPIIFAPDNTVFDCL